MMQELARYWAADYDWRIGCFPSCDPVNAGLRVLRQTDRYRLGPRPHRPRLGSADGAPGIHAICVPRRRLDKGGHFAAWEQPQFFSEEVRAGFTPMRKWPGPCPAGPDLAGFSSFHVLPAVIAW
jgi:hypothetical protein